MKKRFEFDRNDRDEQQTRKMKPQWISEMEEHWIFTKGFGRSVSNWRGKLSWKFCPISSAGWCKIHMNRHNNITKSFTGRIYQSHSISDYQPCRYNEAHYNAEWNYNICNRLQCVYILYTDCQATKQYHSNKNNQQLFKEWSMSHPILRKASL